MIIRYLDPWGKSQTLNLNCRGARVLKLKSLLLLGFSRVWVFRVLGFRV